MSFPVSPTNGQTATVNGISYTYSSATRSWLRNGTLASNIAVTGNITASNYIISGTGIFYSNGTAYSSGGGGVAGNITATDNTTATTLYPVMVGAAGTSQVANVTTTKLTYNASSGNLSTSNLSITGTAIFWANGSPAVYNSSFWVQNQDFGLTANTADYANTLGLVSDTVDTSYDIGSVLNNQAVDATNIVNYTITGTKFSNSIVIQTSGNITTTSNLGVGTTAPAYALDVVGLARGAFVQASGSYTNGNTTPNVRSISFLSISNTAPTTITNFTGGVTGQIIYLLFNDSNTTIDRSNAYLNGGANFTSTSADMLTLYFNGTYWYEVSRSINA